MENDQNSSIRQGGLANKETIVPNTAGLNSIKTSNNDYSDLPYEDPAITNPEELATFPKPAPIVDAEEVENESENRLVNQRSAVRDGRHIARTDNAPDERGYI